jgi:hypothetical protein
MTWCSDDSVASDVPPKRLTIRYSPRPDMSFEELFPIARMNVLAQAFMAGSDFSDF